MMVKHSRWEIFSTFSSLLSSVIDPYWEVKNVWEIFCKKNVEVIIIKWFLLCWEQNWFRAYFLGYTLILNWWSFYKIPLHNSEYRCFISTWKWYFPPNYFIIYGCMQYTNQIEFTKEASKHIFLDLISVTSVN